MTKQYWKDSYTDDSTSHSFLCFVQLHWEMPLRDLGNIPLKRQRALKWRQLFPTTETSNLPIMHLLLYFQSSSSKQERPDGSKVFTTTDTKEGHRCAVPEKKQPVPCTASFVYFCNNSLLTGLSSESGRKHHKLFESVPSVLFCKEIN